MGAWDESSFGNDTANDWAYDLEEVHDLSYIEATLDKVIAAGNDSIDTRSGVEAIAAAEVLAWLRGNPTPVNAYTENIAEWVTAHPIKPSPAIIEKALSVLDRIQTAPSSLLELWDHEPKWSTAMSDLRDRLTS
jgi:hypothetical protein